MGDQVALRFHQRGILTYCHLDGLPLNAQGGCLTCESAVRHESSAKKRLREEFFRHLGDEGIDYSDNQHETVVRRPAPVVRKKKPKDEASE